MSRVESKDSKTINSVDLNSMPGAEAAQALLTGLAQIQAETMQLTCRRARALLELPRAMGACRTMPELAELQTRFAQDLWTDWLQAGQRLAATWSQTLAVPMQAGAAAASQSQPDVTAKAADADPFAVWEWWRTDLKAIVPRRGEPSPASGNRSDTH